MASRYHVESVERAFRILEAFGPETRQMGLSDLARRSGLNKATARRLALTLCDLGYLSLVADHAFGLTPRVLDLGSRFLGALSLPELAEPLLLALSRDVEESVNLAIRDGRDVLYVLRIPAAERILAVNLNVGSRLPLHATSLGKALLVDSTTPEALVAILGEPPWQAFTPATRTEPQALSADLASVRQRGFALSDGELEVGLRAIAAPVRGPDGSVVASVNVSTHSLRVPKAALVGPMAARLLETAAHIEELIGQGLSGAVAATGDAHEKWGQRA